MTPKWESYDASHNPRGICGAPLADLYRRMLLQRRFDEAAALGSGCGGPAGGTEQGLGDEAVAAGAISALGGRDYLVSTYRHRVHHLSRGGAIDFAVLGARTRAGAIDDPSEFADRKLRFVAIFGEQHAGIAAAIELARSCSHRGAGAAVCCLFGDAALAGDSFVRSLDDAAGSGLPIVFVCENNFCGLGTQFDGPDCQETLYRFAAAHGVVSERVDGGEVEQVYRATVTALARARSGGGPALVDAVTYHLRSEPTFDRQDALRLHHPEFWRQRDPVRIARDALMEMDPAAEKSLREIEREVDRALAGAHCGRAARTISSARIARKPERSS
jgi:TPP-dependent pyruvate/acetoin dehydrogenase alpha subunit